MHIVAIIVVVLWSLSSWINHRHVKNYPGPVWSNKYRKAYGIRADKQSASERRWFIACGPLTLIPLALSRKGHDTDALLPLAFKRKEFIPNP